MAWVPGAPGSQLFGIGIFVAAGIAQDVGPAQPFIAQADDGGSVIHSKLLYDPYAGPVGTPPVAAAAGIATTLTATEDGGTTLWSRLVYDPYARPVITAAGAASVINPPLNDATAQVRNKRRVLPGEITSPLIPPTVAVILPPADTGQPTVRRRAAQRDIISAPPGLPVTGTATPATLATTYSGLIVRTSLDQSEVVQPWSAAAIAGTPTSATLATTYSGLIIRTARDHSEVVQPWSVAPAAVVAAAQTFALNPADIQTTRKRRLQTPLASFVFALPVDSWQPTDTDQSARQRKRAIPEGLAAPVTPPAAAVVVSVIYSPLNDTTAQIRNKRRIPGEISGVFIPPLAAGTATPATLATTYSGLIVRISRDHSEVVQPSSPTVLSAGTPTPTAFPFALGDILKTRLRSRAVQPSSFVFALPFDLWPPADNNQPVPLKRKRAAPEAYVYPYQVVAPPPPGTATPSFLFDWTRNAPGYKINQVATRTNDGFTWDPQDPANLTGFETPVVEPPIAAPSRGGVGGRPVYKRLKLKKKLKREECEELLAYLRSLPAQEMQQELVELASRPDIASLLEMMPVATPMQISVKPAEDDDDEECIALLLEILNA